MEMKEYIVSHIEEAIEKNWIEVYYQPVVRTLSSALCGMEALARWRDPVYGFLSPAAFIPALEESHRISLLDRHIIKVICQDIQERLAFNLSVVPVSFNLSWQDFLAFDVLEDLEEEVREHSIPRSFVHVEITEGMILKDSDRMAFEINRFHQAGYKVWMDDFGSGYSSLNVLKDYQFDTIKLDMAFMSNMTERSRQIIMSVVDMAKKIGIRTLAEGVETEEQLEFLRSIGCEKVQGYYFGKPMPLEDSFLQITKKHLHIEDYAW